MPTLNTTTVTVSIDAPYERVAADLADPTTHPEWGTEFFAGPVRPGTEAGEYLASVPMLGGEARYRVDSDPERGIFDLYLAPGEAPYGPPIPVRLTPNGDGVDVLWTLAQAPGIPDEAFAAGLESMGRELEALKRRHEVR